MTQPLYILSACSISPQHTYNEDQFLYPVMSSSNGQLYVIDADYTRYISPVAIRRMSRMLKIGITAGMQCLTNAHVATPDAIILGTARGSVTDMQQFLKDMINMEEQALNPTGFIQSTYNSVNGWLAMLTKCTHYNQTYVNRGFSLELCLFDAQLLLSDTTETKYILAGGFDELTPEYFVIRNKIGYYKSPPPYSLSLLSNYNTPGSMAGEGAHFFTLSNSPQNAACAIHGIAMLQGPSSDDLQSAIEEMLQNNCLRMSDIDVLLCGMNGDSRNSFLMNPLIESCDANTTISAFKHLSGEYDTASGFGLWFANYLFKKQSVPAITTHTKGASAQIRKMLYFNVTIGGNVSLMLLKGV